MDQFLEIPFTEHGSRYGSALGVFAPGGYWVGKPYFVLMWRHALAEIEKLDWSKPQVAETIYGKDRWQPFEFWERLALGRCLKYFVDHDMLPLQVANKGKKGKRKYVRK